MASFYFGTKEEGDSVKEITLYVEVDCRKQQLTRAMMGLISHHRLGLFAKCQLLSKPATTGLVSPSANMIFWAICVFLRFRNGFHLSVQYGRSEKPTRKSLRAVLLKFISVSPQRDPDALRRIGLV